MRYITKKEIKDFIKKNKVIVFEVRRGRTGCHRIYIDGKPTVYYAGGGGYDKTSAVISTLINDIVGKRDYGNVYTGRRGGGARYISDGIGVSALKDAFAAIGGKLEELGNDKYKLYFTGIELEKS